jgi:hypothetical protein
VPLLSLTCACHCFTTGERRSRRARRGRAPLTIASDELLQGLKLRVLEALGVDPRNTAVYVRGRLLDNDDATLAGALQLGYCCSGFRHFRGWGAVV